jgi:hypothetical protein
MEKRHRLTYKTTGDATRASHYCTGPGVKKDDLVQRLGQYEDLGLSPGEMEKFIDEHCRVLEEEAGNEID